MGLQARNTEQAQDEPKSPPGVVVIVAPNGCPELGWEKVRRRSLELIRPEPQKCASNLVDWTFHSAAIARD